MSAKTHKLHTYFLPIMAPGHMIPMIDIAREFAKRGVKVTIITTPLNATQFSTTIERDRDEHGSDITISIVKFPSQEVGLPEDCENLSSTTTLEMTLKFVKALDLLQEPVEKILVEGQADCFVAGAFFWWATDVANKLNIPSLSFHGTGSFPLCMYKHLEEHKPYETVVSDTEEFVLSGLPDVLRMSRRQLPVVIKLGSKHPMAETYQKLKDSESKGCGVIVNSFYELEPAYARYYMEVTKRKAWNIGPVSLFHKSNQDKTHRGKETENSSSTVLSWLDSKKPNSVVYLCFGSMAIFSNAQLIEIANGLEASGQQFIWVVKEEAKDDGWLPEGFERRTEGRGMIIKGWAPQVLILEHEAIGGFVTHCGWNSLLEGIAAGVPMVTWPLSAEQFFNEKLVVEILAIGIPVGAQECSNRTDDREPVKESNIERAVVQLMVGDEAEILRSRARKLGDMAKRAVEKEGSSDTELNSLLEELRSIVKA